MLFVFLVIAFLIGSIPFGYLIGKIFYGVNIQEQGSGNIGMANVTRVLSKKAGVTTFVLDFLKGFVVIFLAEVYFTNFVNIHNLCRIHMKCGPDGVSCFVYAQKAQLLCIRQMFAPFVGFAVVLGHCFTPWLKFKGGKGVATAFGVFCAIAPLAVSAIAGVMYLIILKLTRISALGSFSMLAVFMAFFGYVTFQEYVNRVIVGDSGDFFITAVLISILILYRHKDNIKRLINKKELKL